MSTADVIWEWLGRGATDPDGDNVDVLRDLVEVLTLPLEDVETVVRASLVDGAEYPLSYGATYNATDNYRVGWQVALDPANAPVEALPWLAQFVGTPLNERLAAGMWREAISTPVGWRRGTVAAIKAAARPFLLFGGDVVVNERTPTAYSFEVVYDADQLDDPTLQEVADLHVTLADVADAYYRLDDLAGSEDALLAALARAKPAGLVMTTTKVP